jgi:hypothetical protein
MGEAADKIQPIAAPDVQRAELGDRAELEWVRLDRLRVDRSYQRGLSERSIRLIRRIVTEFSWSRCRPAVGVRGADNTIELLDGQHLATAAATHGGIDEIPVLIVPGQKRESKAADFVSLNRDRVAMTPMNVFRAELASGDGVAEAVAAGVRLGKGRLLERPPVMGRYEIGETVAVGALKRIAKAKGKAGVARAIRIAIAARRAPVSAMMLSALQVLLWSQEYAGELEDDAIAAALIDQAQGGPEGRAASNAKRLSIPAYRALAQLIWQEVSP